ncbi:MAG: hypothetical protein Q9219_003535 [cf. Caloplaca sp. 3 TL-2023]
MATCVAMPARRRALGELSSTRSNKLAMTKHLQTIAAENNQTSTKFQVPSCNFDFASKVKRTFDTYDNEDQENVDPETMLGLGKKAKGSDGKAVKPRQAAHFSLTTVNKPTATESAKITRTTLGVKPRVHQSSTKVDVVSDTNKTKHAGIAARSRVAGKRVVRVGPYVGGGHVPLSSGGNTSALEERSSVPRVGKKGRKGWEFAIHEDTKDEEKANMGQHAENLMEYATSTMDISDDESSGKLSDDRDKENIPPPGCPASAVRPVGRRDMMTEDVRSPLGKLNAADYYAPGCDASSVINAPQEELPGSEPVNVEFGSIDGKLHEDINTKTNNFTSELVNHIEGSLVGNTKDVACNKSNIA